MNILIIGGSGYVGGHIARHLVGAGHAVSGLARSATSRDRVEATGAVAVDGSLTDLDLLEASARGAEAVVYAAIDYSDPAMAGTELPALSSLFTSLGGAPLVYLSTGLVYPDSSKPLTETSPVTGDTAAQPFKVLAERLVLDAGGVVIRPALVHGHGGSGLLVGLHAAARARGVVPYVGDGTQLWSTVHVDDLARLISSLVERPLHGEVFNAAAANPVAIADLASAIAANTGATTVGLSIEQALKVNPAIALLGRTAVLDATKARTLLSWRATGPSLVKDLGSPAYARLDQPAV